MAYVWFQRKGLSSSWVLMPANNVEKYWYYYWFCLVQFEVDPTQRDLRGSNKTMLWVPQLHLVAKLILKKAPCSLCPTTCPSWVCYQNTTIKSDRKIYISSALMFFKSGRISLWFFVANVINRFIQYILDNVCIRLVNCLCAHEMIINTQVSA